MFETLENRELMAADVVWEKNAPPPGFSAKVDKGALVFNGSESRDKVIVHDIVANSGHKQLTLGQKYIEIQHQDSTNKRNTGSTGAVGQSLDVLHALGLALAAGPERWTAMEGGVPIMAGSDCIGGVGVAGGNWEFDEKVAREAAAAIGK